MKLILITCMLLVLFSHFVISASDDSFFTIDESVVVVRRIDDIKFYKDKIIISNFLNSISIYDTNFTFINNIKVPYSVMDSTVEIVRKRKELQIPNLVYLKTSQLLEFMKKEDVKAYFPVELVTSDFINDTILAAILELKVPCVLEKDINQIHSKCGAVSFNTFIFYNINSNNVEEVIYPEICSYKNVNYIINSFVLKYLDDDQLLYFKNNHYDLKQQPYGEDVPLLSSYSLKGQYSETIALMPYEFVEIGLDQQELPIMFKTENKDIWYGTTFSNKIINTTKKDTISIFSEDNYEIFNKINKPEFDGKESMIEFHKDINNRIKFRILDIFLTTNNNFIVDVLFPGDKIRKLQQFDLTGDMIEEVIIHENESIGKLSKISYYKGVFYIFYKTDEDWKVYKRSWDEL